MGFCNYPDIFQEKTNKMFQGFKYIHVYLDGLLVLITGDWIDSLTNMEQIFIKIQGNGLKCNIEKLFLENQKYNT